MQQALGWPPEREVKMGDLNLYTRDKMVAISIFEWDNFKRNPKFIDMAKVAFLCSNKINGISKLHTGLVKTQIYTNTYRKNPDKFLNVSSGVNHRRWLHQVNPSLSKLITQTLGSKEWLKDASLLSGLEDKIESDPELVKGFIQIKSENKRRLQSWVKKHTGEDIPLNALYDVQIKRISRYKRQLSNVFFTMHRYLQIKAADKYERQMMVPRVMMVGTCVAPGYELGENILAFMRIIAKQINEDEEVGDLLKLILIPNNKVSHFEAVLPGADVLQHISTPGTESAGNSNLKFLLNGGRFLTSEDGVNLDIQEQLTGRQPVFHFDEAQQDQNLLVTFGMKDDKAREIATDYAEERLAGKEAMCPPLKKVFNAIKRGDFGKECHPYIMPIIKNLADRGDYSQIIHDFTPYVRAQTKIDEKYRNKEDWCSTALLGIARSGNFSADRMVSEYMRDIWKI